jgi:serine/threonine protein kinase
MKKDKEHLLTVEEENQLLQYRLKMEAEKEEKYQGMKVDIFALGVTLFYLASRRYPFKKWIQTFEKWEDDPHYKLLKDWKLDEFWESHGLQYLSKEFKNLVQQMIHPDENSRPLMATLVEHPWPNGEVPKEGMAECLAKYFKDKESKKRNHQKATEETKEPARKIKPEK